MSFLTIWLNFYVFWFKIRPIFLWAQSEKVKNAGKQSKANKQTLKPGDPFQHFKEKNGALMENKWLTFISRKLLNYTGN